MKRRPAVLGALLAAGVVMLLPASALAAGTSGAAGGGGTPSGTSWLRLAHVAPATGPVDVWLTPFGGTAGPAALHDVSYGSVTPYRAVAPGFYTVAMRAVGVSATSPAMLSATVQVADGHAYTVLAEGAADPLSVHLQSDDLTPPAAGDARVRLVQASTASPFVDVQAVMGPSLASDAAYGAVTTYAQVPQGRWTLQVSAGSAPPTAAQVDVRAGSVSTLLVLNNPSGGVTVRAITDAVGATALPKGGVETGEGGTAGPAPLPLGQDGVAVLVGVMVAGGILLKRASVHAS